MFDLRSRWAEGVHLPGFSFHEHAADEGCSIHDRDQWLKANPAIEAGFLGIDALEMDVATTPEASFRVFRLGQWALAAANWLPVGMFDLCRKRGAHLNPEAGKVFVGIDFALKHDTVGIVAVQPLPDGKLVAEAWCFDPDGEVVNIAAVEALLRSLHMSYDVSEFAYDPAYFERSAQALADDGLPMVAFPQSSARMVPASMGAYEQICLRRLEHDFAPVATEQVVAAVPKVVGEGWRITKGKGGRKNDVAVALVMAIARALNDAPDIALQVH
jgi:phage terminase large subunit-like protein